MSYKDDLLKSLRNVKNLELLKDKTVYITGATGQIGRSIITVIRHLNETESYNTKLILNVRSADRIDQVFSDIKDFDYVSFQIGNITEEIEIEGDIDYIISAASNTHPVAYAKEPVETVLTNVEGAKNVFNLAVKKNARVINLSSVEIYGDSTNETAFKETDMGYIDCNTTRACYNEGKRLAETLLQAYIAEYNLDAVTVRLPRLFGPETKKDDTKALSQFINNAVNHEDIVLKSAGEQYFSYLYATDAISGILTILLNGKTGEAYNLSNPGCDIKLKDLAAIIAETVGQKVIFDLPDETESKGFSKSAYAILDSTKVRSELGWDAAFSIKEAIKSTIDQLS